MFCRNCGKEVAENAKVCLGCGADPKGKGTYCFGCGTTVHSSAIGCTKCGADLNSSSSSDKPTVITIAGVLMLIGSCISLFLTWNYLVLIIYYFILILIMILLSFFTLGITLIYAVIIFLFALLIVFRVIILLSSGAIGFYLGINLMGKGLNNNPIWVGIIQVVIGLLVFNPIIFGTGVAVIILLLLPESKKYFEKKIESCK